MPSYLVKEPLLHDGEKFAPGDSVEMEAKAARDLLAQGVIAAVKAEPKAKAEPKTEEGK